NVREGTRAGPCLFRATHHALESGTPAAGIHRSRHAATRSRRHERPYARGYGYSPRPAATAVSRRPPVRLRRRYSGTPQGRAGRLSGQPPDATAPGFFAFRAPSRYFTADRIAGAEAAQERHFGPIPTGW